MVRGDQLGKKIGFPTANIQLKHNRPPLSGIFVVEVEVDSDREAESRQPSLFQGVASLGVRQTVHERGRPVLEAHLFDFAENVYGRHMQVHFLHKLRDEERYPDLDTLIQQIERDVEDAKYYFSLITATPLTTEQKLLQRSN